VTVSPQDVGAALARMGLWTGAGEPTLEPLAGGVSSDIWKVDLPSGPICVKRALPKLKVAADWRAPIARNHYEARWMETAARFVPEAVPRLLGQDRESGTLAMAFLSPDAYPNWKELLLAGRIARDTAEQVGRTLATIHAGTATVPSLAADFPTDAIFEAIRVEPYLLATARVHPSCAAALLALAETTRSTRRALVHGDASPKNILIGPHGPVFLDAECAWWGDPAFDLAFCLNHLLLKCLWRPDATPHYLMAFESLASAYLDAVSWEPRDGYEARAAALLPALLLARIDGKSPVEYVTREVDKALVRSTAAMLLHIPPIRLEAIRRNWAAALKDRPA
jgi:aminoglycoside phosphotransferase (APT) family kinase protein